MCLCVRTHMCALETEVVAREGRNSFLHCEVSQLLMRLLKFSETMGKSRDIEPTRGGMKSAFGLED